MPRLTRLLHPGVATHVIQRGNNRQEIFFDDADREQYLAWLGEALRAEGCSLHAYVLMSNHVHLLLTGAAARAVPRVLQSLGRRYVARVNRLRGRSGTLWEGRYKSTLIDSDGYLLACYCYIEANPIRAGMVARPEQHPWSSWRRNGFGEADPLVTPHPLYDQLGPDIASRAAAYRALFEQGLDAETLATLRDATQRGWLPGGEQFRAAMSATLNRPTGPRSRGRPRKRAPEPEPGDDPSLREASRNRL
jgi:putative transposase